MLVNSLLRRRVWGINQKGSTFASERFISNGGSMECINSSKVEMKSKKLTRWKKRNKAFGKQWLQSCSIVGLLNFDSPTQIIISEWLVLF
jgi:hypothetical protein